MNNKSTSLMVEEEQSLTVKILKLSFIQKLKKILIEVSDITRFALRFFKNVFLPPYEFAELIRQCYLIGYRSFSLIGITGFIMGLVLTIQAKPTMAAFGAESLIPGMVAVSMIREIGPVITALICAGKIGSGIGAELGSMKVTEQIEAMEVSATNPFKFLVVNRILACTFMIPLLVILSDAIGLLGSYIGVNISGDVSIRLFFNQIFSSLEFIDIYPAFIKTFFFGFVIGLIGCYKGYNSNKGTEGVGKAANTAVVVASLLVFIIDMIAVQITSIMM
ncbi:MAG: ABC transporter permease [Bacteroidia bacterium]